MLTHYDELASRAAERARQEFLQRAVPIHEWDNIRANAYPGSLPIVGLDCRKRPDIIELLQAGAQEHGFSDSHTAWSVLLDPRGDSLFVLRITLHASSGPTFTVAFKLCHRTILNAVAAIGVLAITAGDIMRHSQAWRVEICTDELRQGLILHDLLTSVRSRQARYG
jgi:hypothetical protein